MVVTLVGIVIDVTDEHDWKACEPIEWIDDDNNRRAKRQVLMTIPMIVTLVGITTAVNDIHVKKAAAPSDLIDQRQEGQGYTYDDSTDGGDTSRNSHRRQCSTVVEGIVT